MANLNVRLVLRNDSTANWLENESVVLLKGEAGIEFLADGKTKMKIGDGVKTWAELPYFGGEDVPDANVFEVTLEADETHNDAIDRVASDTVLSNGDIAIVKTLIADDKYSHTAYVYNGTVWAAMDGNYNAKNVYFDEDFTFTKAIGTVTIPSSGSTVVTAEGKNIKEFFASLFASEQNPTTTEPSAKFDSVTTGAKEVGTVVTPTWDAGLNAGSYTYGPSTGVVATSWAISNNTTDETATTEKGSFADITVTESTNYKITAVATYADGAMPVTNIGNDYAAGQIKAGTKSVTSSAISGYRAWFYGWKDAGDVLDVSALTSNDIRGLTASNGSIPGSMTTTKMQQMFFAAPTGKIKAITVANATNGAPQTVAKTTVSVEGANGYTATAYDVYYVNNAAAESGTTKFNIAVSK